jgi:hypothetical protein
LHAGFPYTSASSAISVAASSTRIQKTSLHFAN